MVLKRLPYAGQDHVRVEIARVPACSGGMQLKALFLVALVWSGLPVSNASAQDLASECNGNDVDKSIAACTSIINGDSPPVDQAASFLNRGIRLLFKGDIDGSILDFRSSIALDPSNARSYVGRGTAQARKHNYDAALEDINRAIQINPRLFDAYTARGQISFERGDVDAAINDATKAIEIDPRQPAPFNNRGTAYREKGEFQKSLADLNVAVRLLPLVGRPLYNRGLTYLRMGDLARATVDFDAAALRSPKDAEIIAARETVRAEMLAQQNSKPVQPLMQPPPIAKNDVGPPSQAPSVLPAANPDYRSLISSIDCRDLSHDTISRMETKAGQSSGAWGIHYMDWGPAEFEALKEQADFCECLVKNIV